MRIAFLSVIVCGIISVSIFSCGDKKPSSQSVTQDSLLITYLALTDSVDQNWAIMIDDDDDKHVLMKRLLLEVSYTNNYDKGRFDELNNLIEQLKELRYDQKSMSNSSSIDEYDSATFDLSDQIFLFARNHPRFENTPLMGELIDDISAKNNYILMHRIHYDNWVKELNAFKEKNKEQLISNDASIETAKMPLFQLPS
jgi:hypothetical protein